MSYKHYIYNGPVMEFNMGIANKWEGETYAKSDAQARSNLAYQFKRNTKRNPRSKIAIPGKLVVI